MEEQELLSPYWTAISDSLKCQGRWEKIDMGLLLIKAVCCNQNCIDWMERHRKISEKKMIFPEVNEEFWEGIPDKWRKYAPEVYRILCSRDFKFFFSLLEAGWSLFSEALFLRERLTFEDAAELILEFCAPVTCKIEVLSVLWTMAFWYQVDICRELSFYAACECMKEKVKNWTN